VVGRCWFKAVLCAALACLLPWQQARNSTNISTSPTSPPSESRQPHPSNNPATPSAILVPVLSAPCLLRFLVVLVLVDFVVLDTVAIALPAACKIATRIYVSMQQAFTTLFGPRLQN